MNKEKRQNFKAILQQKWLLYELMSSQPKAMNQEDPRMHGEGKHNRITSMDPGASFSRSLCANTRIFQQNKVCDLSGYFFLRRWRDALVRLFL